MKPLLTYLKASRYAMLPRPLLSSDGCASLHVECTLLMLQDWSQLRSLDLSWASPEPVMFGDTLTRLTQLEDVSLNLRDCSGLEQLPPHVTALSLQTSSVLDMAAMPCLQCCSSLRRLRLDCNTGVCTDLVDWCACANAYQEWLRGL